MPAKKPPPKEYLHVLMAIHPMHGKAIPIKTFDDEVEAWKAAADANEKGSHLGYHVKKVMKSGVRGG